MTCCFANNDVDSDIKRKLYMFKKTTTTYFGKRFDKGPKCCHWFILFHLRYRHHHSLANVSCFVTKQKIFLSAANLQFGRTMLNVFVTSSAITLLVFVSVQKKEKHRLRHLAVEARAL